MIFGIFSGSTWRWLKTNTQILSDNKIVVFADKEAHATFSFALNSILNEISYLTYLVVILILVKSCIRKMQNNFSIPLTSIRFISMIVRKTWHTVYNIYIYYTENSLVSVCRLREYLPCCVKYIQGTLVHIAF